MRLLDKVRRLFRQPKVEITFAHDHEDIDHRLAKADSKDFQGRFREILSDPLNLLIRRDPKAGLFDGSLVHLHNGMRVPLFGPGAYYGDFSSILRLNRGVHEPLEEFVFQELLDGLSIAPRMLELGAYWGHYSMWLKAARPNADVCLVEPDENNLHAGQRNFDLNGQTGRFLQAFVGDGHFEVDRYCHEQEISKLDILHSDIQGYEVQMLGSCRRMLSDKLIDYCFISTHSQELHHRVVELLGGYGYRVEVSSDFENETTSFDGFVFASNPNLAPRFEGFVPLSRLQIAETNPELVVDYLTNTLRVCRGHSRN